MAFDKGPDGGKGSFGRVVVYAVAGILEAFQLHEMRRQTGGYQLAALNWGDWIGIACQDQGWAFNASERGTEIEAARFTVGAGEMQRHRVVANGAVGGIGVF